MAKVLVNIPDDLMAAAVEAAGPGATKSAVIRSALQQVVETHRQQALIDWIEDTDPFAELRDPAVTVAAHR